MYSPKIAEHLIPSIYRLARARGTHMTTLVNEALTRYLADQNLHQTRSATMDSELPPSSNWRPNLPPSATAHRER